MSKNSSAKYYQDNKKRLQKRLVKDIKIFLKMKNTESNKMDMKDVKIFLKVKNKNHLSIKQIL